MADLSQGKSPEKISTPSAERIEQKREAPKIGETAGVRREASEIVTSIETKEGKEGAAEFSEGKVSEQVSETKKKAPMGSGTASLTTDEIEAIRAKLLANLPPQKVMVEQIKKSLRGEEKKLTRQYRAAKKEGVKAAWQLSNIVAKLRKVNEYFALIANATFEVIKQLWLKIVHGV